MSDRDTVLLWVLALLNAGAFGLWLSALRFRVVVDRPDLSGTRALARRGRGALGNTLGRLRGGIAPWTGRLGGALLRPRWGERLKARGRRVAEAAAASALDSWIEQVERVEAAPPAPRPDPAPAQAAVAPAEPTPAKPIDGSEEWWREWAASGEVLPQAAGSRRRAASRPTASA